MRNLLFICIAITWPLLSQACVSKDVHGPVLLTPGPDATVEELVGIINHYGEIQTLTGRVDLQFQSERQIEQGLIQRYRTAEGRIVLARPGKIRLQIQVPLVKTTITELASDGERFQVIVYPKEYRTFVQGLNSREYTANPEDIKSRQRLREAGAFAHIRPQHFTDAILIPAIDLSDADIVVVKEEFRKEEGDKRPNAGRGARVIKTYSILSVIELVPGKGGVLRRKYWFDRSRDLLLVREQLYGGDGELRANIIFDDFIRLANFDGFLPTKIRLQRPHDYYSVTLSFHNSSLQLNADIVEQAFRLQKPSEWEDVEEVDLDKPNGKP